MLNTLRSTVLFFDASINERLKLVFNKKGLTMSYFNVPSAMKCYRGGGNVTEHLKSQTGSNQNTSEIIEIAYDLQAGSYTEFANKNPVFCNSYAEQIATVISEHLEDGDTLLDVGSGEMTTLALVLGKLNHTPSEVYAFDISWSRIAKGREFLSMVSDESPFNLVSFVANMEFIPLASKSVDVLTSNHALEPNGGNLEVLLKELFRVAKKTLVLFEPCYEMNTDVGKARMDDLGYIKGMQDTIEKLGGKLLLSRRMELVANPLNPTACFVIEPPSCDGLSIEDTTSRSNIFTMPGSDMPLAQSGSFLFSHESGLVFPILNGIPVIKKEQAILATAFMP